MEPLKVAIVTNNKKAFMDWLKHHGKKQIIAAIKAAVVTAKGETNPPPGPWPPPDPPPAPEDDD